VLNGASVTTPAARLGPVCSRSAAVSCRAKVEAEDLAAAVAVPALPRRLALALLAGAVAAGSRASPANAAYGESGK